MIRPVIWVLSWLSQGEFLILVCSSRFIRDRSSRLPFLWWKLLAGSAPTSNLVLRAAHYVGAREPLWRFDRLDPAAVRRP